MRRTFVFESDFDYGCGRFEMFLLHVPYAWKKYYCYMFYLQAILN